MRGAWREGAWLLALLVGIALALWAAGGRVGEKPAGREASLQGCERNLQSLARALEAYARDRAGRLPGTESAQGAVYADDLKKALVPAYLPSMPVCPGAGCDTYSPTYTPFLYAGQAAGQGTATRSWSIACLGRHHAAAGLPTHFPAMDSSRGLLTRSSVRLQAQWQIPDDVNVNGLGVGSAVCGKSEDCRASMGATELLLGSASVPATWCGSGQVHRVWGNRLSLDSRLLGRVGQPVEQVLAQLGGNPACHTPPVVLYAWESADRQVLVEVEPVSGRIRSFVLSDLLAEGRM